MKKVIVMFCAAMVAVVCSVPALAEYWNEGNNGDSWETAYIIASPEDFLRMRQNTNVGGEESITSSRQTWT
ncbi:MAG: hypothetical protein IJR85_07660 [Synergistaceae bacterium]|nr:hypothetical protein [Synergistaceae bacterium]